MNVKHWETNQAYDVDFTIATSGATMVVSCQLKDFAGNALTGKNAVMMYVTTDADGNTLEAMGAEAVVATNGFVNIIIATSMYYCVTEDNGVVAFTLDGDGAVSNYVNIVVPSGKVITSEVVTFSA